MPTAAGNKGMDRLLFGDNQFFGVNHVSETKAMAQLMQFQDDVEIIRVLKDVSDEGIKTFMCTTHERMEGIADHIRQHPQDFPDFKFFPCMPYAHKYANAVTEEGILGTLRKYLPEDGMMSSILKGGVALANKDVEFIATALIDAEMKMFHGLSTPVIFLQNVVVDLLLGLKFHEAFRIFAAHVRRRYNAEPGFITMNLPALLDALEVVGEENPIVCANFNKIGFRVSGGQEAYLAALAKRKCRLIAMSVFASGAIPAEEAVAWVCAQHNVESIVFGASRRSNIRSTRDLVSKYSEAEMRVS